MHPKHHAQSNPNKAAYIMAGSGETVTYKELDDRSNQGAQLFRSLGIQAGERLRFVAHPRQPDSIGHRQVVEGGVDAAEEQPAGRAVLRFVQARQLAEQARVSPAVIGQQALQVSGEVLHQASARRP